MQFKFKNKKLQEKLTIKYLKSLVFKLAVKLIIYFYELYCRVCQIKETQ